MPDRLSSDHPSIGTHRVRVARYGGRRRRLIVPVGVIPDDEVVRLILDGSTRYARIHRTYEGDETILGAYTSPGHARDPAGETDHLATWLSTNDITPGSSVHLDVIEPGVAYGLRLPGERVVYEAVTPPSSSLQDIARRLEETD